MFGRNTKKHASRKLYLIDENAPFAFVEAYKSLRTNVDFICGTNGYKSLLVTSADSADGKSTVTMNLARALADGGKRVAVVDGDMRKASLSSYLKISRNVPGITAVLMGAKPLSEALIREESLKCWVLPVGRLPSNPAEVVGSERMIQMLTSLSEQFDYVLLDTPPVSLVTDAAILSRWVDGVILVARSDETARQALAMSKKKLEDVNARILGVVLNDYNAKRHSYGRGYYYSGYYYRYSAYGYDKTAQKKRKKHG